MLKALALFLVLCAAGGLYWLFESPREADPIGPSPTPLPIQAPVRKALVQESDSKPVPRPAVPSPASDEALILANNLGARLLGEGDLESALKQFELCARERPNNEIFAGNLSETLVRLALQHYAARELDLAIERMARGLELAPDRTRLHDLLGRWRAEAEVELDHWSQASDLLELSYDVTRPDLRDNAAAVMVHLERAYGDLQLWFGVDPVRELGISKIRVVLYGDQEFDRLTGLGDWAGGVFDGVVRIAVGEMLSDELSWRRTMTHELAHAYIFSLGGNAVPGWLNEGLAQLLESPEPELERARMRLGSTRFALSELKNSLATWTDREKISKAYAQSLLFVELIRHQHGDEVLRRMVVGCRQGTDPAESFEAYTALPLESLFEFLR